MHSPCEQRRTYLKWECVFRDKPLNTFPYQILLSLSNIVIHHQNYHEITNVHPIKWDRNGTDDQSSSAAAAIACNVSSLKTTVSSVWKFKFRISGIINEHLFMPGLPNYGQRALSGPPTRFLCPASAE